MADTNKTPAALTFDGTTARFVAHEDGTPMVEITEGSVTVTLLAGYRGGPEFVAAHVAAGMDPWVAERISYMLNLAARAAA